MTEFGFLFERAVKTNNVTLSVIFPFVHSNKASFKLSASNKKKQVEKKTLLTSEQGGQM